MCYYCHSTSPSYVTDMKQKEPPHSHNTRYSSHTMFLHNRSAHSKATFCDRFISFSYVWNSIPNDGTVIICATTATAVLHHHMSLTCCWKKPSHTRNTRSSSYTMPLLNWHAHSKATLGDRSFSFTSSVWNSIPNDIRCAPSLSSFKSRLMTYLFRSVCKDWTLSLITVYMCMAWPCHSLVDGLS